MIARMDEIARNTSEKILNKWKRKETYLYEYN